ncbi:MAG: prepilin-type cleavage/methylation domain-containing protein, partial [Paraglaciecola polaris]
GAITLKNTQTVQTDYGYARHDWDLAWDEMLDANITVLNDTAACTVEFCVDESFDITSDLPTGVTVDEGNTALVIYPNGTAKTGACYAYYTYAEGATAEGSVPVIGSITSGC